MHDPAFDSVLLDLDDEFVFESDEDKVHGMIDRFMRDITQKKSAAKSERGRPRKHFTKKAGRGRPKKGERRIEVTLPLNVEIVSGKFYIYTNGILREANP